MACVQLFAFALALATTVMAAELPQKVQVAVYYESLCPDSMKFITMQLSPVWNSNLGSYMNVTLIPYGKSSYKKAADDSYTFECHHGPMECYGNKVQACALKGIPTQDLQIKFVNCAMENGKKEASEAEYPLVMCADKVQVPAEPIQTCVNSTEGDEALVEMGEKTDELQPKLSSVPTIVLNNKVNSNDQALAVKDLKEAVCSYITTNKPADCSKNTAAKIASTLLLPLFAALVLTRV